MEQRSVLAIDGGQSEIRIRADRDRSRTLVLPGVLTDQPVLPQLASAIAAAKRHFGQDFDSFCIGTTGLTKTEEDPAALKSLLDLGESQRIFLAHDSVSSYLGALGEKTGVVVAAGTGVVVLGVGDSALARVDGWGSIMGDAGSGYWIGARVLQAVMREHDGRGEPTALTPIVRQHWDDLEQAYIRLQADPQKIAVVASFARHAAQLAGQDAASSRIIDEAAQELAHSAATALRRCRLLGTGDARVAGIGGVLGSQPMRLAFAAALERLAPGAVLVEPLGQGLEGIELMDQLSAGHPLRQMIRQA
ncbi:N-acetylglucosamine kinase [Glutamicibacter uratoxydans]|uniref:N-acetylglucosamine kinase n=1 Tax=Glutamicibacter uratoxydans TaxID=43667 RepID=UPI00114417C8|nr:BadF/BadG/BcrA/BcrD ATPase family protein [Glutamicibacter uratoxydans]